MAKTSRALVQHLAGVGGVDDVVDVAPFGGDVRVGVGLPVQLDQLGPPLGRGTRQLRRA